MRKAVMYNMASKKHKKYNVQTDLEEKKRENSEEKVTATRKSSSKRP